MVNPFSETGLFGVEEMEGVKEGVNDGVTDIVETVVVDLMLRNNF